VDHEEKAAFEFAGSFIMGKEGLDVEDHWYENRKIIRT
jgi:hypothetical protein